jgi:hypothetical protein
MSAPTFPIPDVPFLHENASLAPFAPAQLAAPVATPEVAETLLDQKAVLVSLTLSQIGRTRQVKEGAVELAQHSDGEEKLVEANTDKSQVRVVKTLFKCGELKAIESLDSEIRAFISRKCLKSPLKGKSVYLVPMGMVEQVDTKLRDYVAQRDQVVAQFVNVYPRLLQEAQQQLRDLYDAHDYPNRDHVAACFSLRWRFFALMVPDALGEISTQIWEQERAKAAADWAEAQEEIQMLLRVRLKSMIEHLVERLKPGADGKQKIFRNTAVTNMTEFINDFSALNITNDHELAQTVENVRSLMNGVDAQTLRDSKKVREVVLNGAAKIESELSTLIVAKPKRLIELED